MEQKIKTINIIHISLCIGVLIAYVVIGEIYNLDKLAVPKIDSGNIIYLGIPLAAYFLSNFLFKMQLKTIDTAISFEDKFPFYQVASIIRWAVLEAAAFIILILKPDFLLFGILILVYLILLRPTTSKIKEELNSMV